MGKMPEKQLELSKRSTFFSDPFFADLKDSMGAGLERRLAEFSARSMGVAGAGLGEAAHNIQVSASNDKFQIQLELPGFAPEDLSLKTKDDIITIKLNGRTLTIEAAGHGEHFRQKHVVPDNINLDLMSSSFSSDGVLVIKAPKMK